MPLAYDEIPGSWGIYSKGWPEVHYEKYFQDIIQAFVVKGNRIPYGSYVFMTYPHQSDFYVRLETHEQAKLVQDFVNNLHK